MKNLVHCLLTFFISTLVVAQETDGYYLNKTGDTIRGKVQVPLKPKLKLGASSQSDPDPLRDDVPNESKEIDYSKLTFDFKFSEDGNKFKKIDRLKVKGFGFVYNDHHYDFVTWDVAANKQLYLVPATGDVVPDGVYFILRSVEGALPIYSLFQEIEMSKRNSGRKEYDGNATKRDIIFKHPTRGFLYISNQYPLMMKLPDALQYLELEEAFIRTLNKKDNLFEIVKKYNVWKVKN
ncbi:MAG: hypothetical protein WBO38_06325 [Chitinophagaceae bacterium]